MDEDIKMDRSADSQDDMITPKVEEDIDPGLADWFKVDEKTMASPLAHEADDDSATEDDSDHADVAPDATDEVDLDDWFKVKPMNEGSTSTKSVSKLSNYL
jgi:DNA ligase-4